MLIDREAERARLEALVSDLREGRSGALVLRGEPGIGKTALADAVLEAAGDLRVVRALGQWSDAEAPYRGLARLMAPFGDVVSGLSGDAPPSVYLVGQATLTLLADAARATPVVCFVDDAHWLDAASATALAFVARRLLAEGVLLLFSETDGYPRSGALAALPELRLDGLPDADALRVLEREAADRLDAAVARRIVARSVGNPLALREVVRQLAPEELAGIAALPEPLPLPAELAQLFAAQARRLAPHARELLEVAAAQSSDELAVLTAAAERLGVPAGDVGALDLGGLATLRPRIAFRHPLIRSAIYESVGPERRRAIHAALAASIDAVRDPDLRAWHLAASVDAPSEAIARELEDAAGRARARGGYGAESALHERAAELTPAPADRDERVLAAAAAALQAGDARRATALLDAQPPAAPTALLRARRLRVRAGAEMASGSLAEGPALLIEAARALEPFDPDAASGTWMAALNAAYIGHGSPDSPTLAETARAALRALGPRRAAPSIEDELFLGLATLVAGDYAAAVPILRGVLASPELPAPSPTGGGAHASMVLRAAWELWDLDGGRRLLTRLAGRDREVGALGDLRMTLRNLRWIEVYAGRFSTAQAFLDEAVEIEAAMGQPQLWQLANVEQWTRQGRDDLVLPLAEEARAYAEKTGTGGAMMAYNSSSAALHNSRGRYADALACAQAVWNPDLPGYGAIVLPELIEAAAGAGDVAAARAALGALAGRAELSGTPWALGLLARSRGVVAAIADGDPDAAAALFDDARRSLTAANMPLDAARVPLLEGETWARAGRRDAAADALQRAHRELTALGAQGFADRAATALQALGVRAAGVAAPDTAVLTPREREVAELAAGGATNREIAGRLFVSEATVAYYLGRVYRALGITSRRELPGVMAPQD